MREYVACVIFERGSLFTTAEDEKEARAAYDQAMQALSGWRAEEHQGLTPAAAGKKEGELQKLLNKAQSELAQYDPDVDDPIPSKPQKVDPEPVLPKEGKATLIDIDDVIPLQLYPWKQYAKAIKGIPYRGRGKGSHPGEEWLAAILGAEQQGDATKFDLVTRDGKKWEVKDVEDGEIRPGRLGRDTFQKAYDIVMSVARQMRNFRKFVDAAEATQSGSMLQTEEDRKRFKRMTDVLDASMGLIKGGEISNGTFISLRRAVKAASLLRERWAIDMPKQDVVVRGRTLTVSYDKYVAMLNKIGDAEALTDVPRPMQAVSRLTSEAFDNPNAVDAWLVKLLNSIKPTHIFPVAGVFLVTEEGGFTLMLHDQLNEKLEFIRTSKGEPRFEIKL